MQFHLIFDSITIARALAFYPSSIFLCFQRKEKKNDSIESESVSATWSWIVPLKQNSCWLLIMQRSTSKCTHTHTHGAHGSTTQKWSESREPKFEMKIDAAYVSMLHKIWKTIHFQRLTSIYRVIQSCTANPHACNSVFQFVFFFFLPSPECPVSIEK